MDTLPVQPQATRISAGHAEQHMRQFGAPRPDQPGQPQHLAATQDKADIGEFPATRQPPCLQHHRCSALVLCRDMLVKARACHQFGQAALGHPLGRIDTDQSAIAQHGDAVRYIQHLCQPVADEHHRHPARRQGAHHRQQRIGFGLGQRRGRFIHEDQPGIRHQCPGNRHDLALRNRQGAQPCIKIKHHIQLRQRGFGRHPQRRVPHPPGPRAQQGFERDVFTHGHFGKQRQILPDHRNTVTPRDGRGDLRQLFAEKLHPGTRFGLIDPGDDLDKRAFAAAVFARQTMHLSRADRKGRLVQRGDATEHLGQSGKPDGVWANHGGSPGPVQLFQMGAIGGHRVSIKV